MKKTKAFLAVFMAALLIATVLPFSVFAAETGNTETQTETENDADSGDTNTDGLKMKKSYDPESKSLRLEAYVTGETQTTQVCEPVDIVLLLDVSGSMEDDEVESFTAVYDPQSTSTKYYCGDNYTEVYYCSGDSSEGCSGGWFTQTHGECDGHGGTKMTPKKSKDDTAVDAVQFYTYDGEITLMEALQKDVNAFIENVQKNSDAANPNRIAIVKYADAEFASEKYKEGNGYTSDRCNLTQIVKNLTTVYNTANDAGTAALKNAVNDLDASGDTASDYALELAEYILENNKDAARQQSVVMFTDGVPNHGGNPLDKTVANDSISTAYRIKNDLGASIYTIGYFASEPSNNTVNYMKYVSSAYPQATGLASGGTASETGSYFSNYTSSAAELERIFDAIAVDIGTPHYKLDEKTVLKDVMSEFFKIDDSSDGVTVYTATCTAIDGDNNPTAWESDNNSDRFNVVTMTNDEGTITTWDIYEDGGTKYVATVTLNYTTNTLLVTGFNYSEHWVGNHSGKAGGKKLVVTIPILALKEITGDVPTNDDDSGIYEDPEDPDPVEPFPVPVYEPECIYIVHSSDPTNPQTVAFDEINEDTVYDFTKAVYTETTKTVGETEQDIPYLYGGLFTDADMTVPAAENPMAYHVTKDTTYYLKEVSNEYLRPRTLTIRKYGTLSTYMITAVDGVNYRQVGFSIDSENENIAKCSLADDNFTADTLYDSITATMTNGWKYSYVVNGETVTDNENKTKTTAMFAGRGLADGGIVCTPFTGLYTKSGSFAGGENELVFNAVPFYITLDGVKVSGIVDRKLTYIANPERDADTAVLQGLTYTDTYTMKDGKIVSDMSYVGIETASASKMTFAAGKQAFSMGADEQKSIVCITRTTDDTEAPLVGYAGNLTGSVTPEVKADSVFAGWYTDAQQTEAADFSDVQSDMTVYAKYKEDSYLKARTLNLQALGFNGLVLVTSTATGVASTGFIVTVNGEETDIRAKTLSGIGGLLSAWLFGTPFTPSGALATAQFSADVPDGTPVSVLPYWVTADGTTVYGSVYTTTY